MSDKTARHYRDHRTLPGARKKSSVPRTYRTRPDPFAAVWPLVEHPVLFSTCSLLVQELLAAKRDLKLERVLKRLAGFAALVIDDLGYVQQSREEMEVLFTLLEERYERGSVLLTSNLPFSQWTAIFKDPMTTAAAIDRLVHHSVIVELNAPSYRLETAKGAKATPAHEPEPATSK